jgi:predicted ATP-dependent serine protease
MALDQGVLDGVVNANFKTVAEAATVGLSQALAVQAQNLASHQQRLNLLAESSLAQMLNRMNALDPEEAASISKVEKSDVAKLLAELGGSIAAIQQQLKGAQTSLPETGR